MNKAHRDRIAFMRICSGRFERGMDVYHVQGGKKIKLSQSTQLMASEREIVDEAYAGDIIGILTPAFFPLATPSPQPRIRLPMRAFPRLHRSILRVFPRWIP